MGDDSALGPLDRLYADSKRLIASGQLSDAERSHLEEHCASYDRMTNEERESHNYFLLHMPDNDADVTMVVLKGHLLIEQRIREFIAERMLAPEALTEARLSAHQAICLAEALTLPNDEPQKLWAFLRQVNSLRNTLAHRLDPAIQDRIDALIAEYSKTWPVRSGLAGLLGHAFGQLSELCRLARAQAFACPAADKFAMDLALLLGPALHDKVRKTCLRDLGGLRVLFTPAATPCRSRTGTSRRPSAAAHTPC